MSFVTPPEAMVPVMGAASSVIDEMEGAAGGTMSDGVTVAEIVAVCPVKARLFNSTLAVLDPLFAVMMSSLPSPFTSPMETEFGAVPVAKVACV